MATTRRAYPTYLPPAPTQPSGKTLPIRMPSKAPAYHYPVSRIAMSPDLTDSSTATTSSGGGYSAYPRSSNSHSGSGSRSSAAGTTSYSGRSNSSYAGGVDEFDGSYRSTSGVDVSDMLSERMNAAFDPMRLDKSLAKQAQTSGTLNDKNRQLAEMQARAQRRLQQVRTSAEETSSMAREGRRDLDYVKAKTSSMQSKAKRRNPEAYAQAQQGHASRRSYDDY